MTRALVSVIITCFNHGRYLRSANSYVLSQSRDDRERIVFDVGSTDDSWERFQQHTGPRIRLFRNECTKGMAQCLNELAKAARAELVARMEGASAFLPDGLAAVYRTLQDDANAVVAGLCQVCIDSETRVLGLRRHALDARTIDERLDSVPDAAMARCAAFRKSALQETEGYRHQVVSAEEYDVLHRIAGAGNFTVCARFMYAVREDGGKDAQRYIVRRQGTLLAQFTLPAMNAVRWALHLRGLGSEVVWHGHFGGFDVWFAPQPRGRAQQLAVRLVEALKSAIRRRMQASRRYYAPCCGLIARRKAPHG